MIVIRRITTAFCAAFLASFVLYHFALTANVFIQVVRFIMKSSGLN